MYKLNPQNLSLKNPATNCGDSSSVRNLLITKLTSSPQQAAGIEASIPFNDFNISSNLKTSFIGKVRSFYDQIDSTNDTARKLALKGAADGFAVIADYQKKGKGRLGRTWESPAGVNIYTSIILRPDISPKIAPQLTLVSAVAVADTIAKYLNHPSPSPLPNGKRDSGKISEAILEVKWPNDILINSKKAAGILTEMNSDVDKINFVIIGIGVNINMQKEMFPEILRQFSTSLKEETGQEISRIDFIQILYLNLEKWYREYLNCGFEPIRKAWKGYFKMTGKLVKIKEIGKVTEGIVVDIDIDGALLLQEKNGSIIRIISGDVLQ